MSKLLILLRAFFALCALSLQVSAMAQSNSANPADDVDQPDPPERVARLSYLRGKVNFHSEDESEWSDASINRPLTTGDRLHLERNARAELQTGPLDIQLDQGSEFSFLELTDDVAQVRLTAGALYLSVRRLRDDEVIEVDTPHAAIAISKPGEYSIALVDDGDRTLVRTYSGECEVTDQREAVTIKSREQATFSDDERDADRAGIEPAGIRTAFDSWAHDRVLRTERSVSTKYVDDDVIGYSDLDEYGEWVHEVDYGHVWIPRHVAAEWSPYRYGRWTWISPWGWTWVDDAPWGFAPFHYGRWAHVRGRWCWVPGPLHVRPVYAPALVAWVGTTPPRSRISFSIAFGGGIGWFPLAPLEVYVPSYHCSRRYIHNVNYANTRIVNNVYINRAYNNRSTYFDHVNRHVRDAVTVVNADAFSHSRPVREHRIRVDQRDLGSWQTHNAIPLEQPRREHAVNASRGDRPGAVGERTVVMRRDPAVAMNRNTTSERFNNRRGIDREPPVRAGSAIDPNAAVNPGARAEARSDGPSGDRGRLSRPETLNRSRGNESERIQRGTPRGESPRAQQDWRAPPDAPLNSAPPIERREMPRERNDERRPERVNSERFSAPRQERSAPERIYAPRERVIESRPPERQERSDPPPQAQPQPQAPPRQHEDRGSNPRHGEQRRMRD